MDDLGKRLLDFFSTVSLKKAKKELYNLLEADNDEVYVYYLTPLANLRKIIADGGIKCRAMIGSNATDLSAQNVQARRDRTVNLAQMVSSSFTKIEKKVHECVNFFWNPINHTSFAFQRNSLLIAADKDNDTYGIVCILEMKLAYFFQSDRVYWTTSQRNLVTTYDNAPSFYDGSEEFDWQTIFSLRSDNDDWRSSQFRSAEFVAFYQNPSLTFSDLIPIQFLHKILVSTQYGTKIKNILPSSIQNQIYPLMSTRIFYPKRELLKPEKRLMKTISNLQSLRLPAEKFSELINTFSNFSEYLGCNLTAKYFANKDIAYGIHGIGHTTRVMFWVHVLSYLANIGHRIEKVAQYAAFIHDMGRQNNREDDKHGSKAVNKYQAFLKQKQIPDRLMRSCRNAVIYHCKADTKCPDKNLVWKLLKDADSLERGRFAPPKGRGKWKENKGCDVNYLRLDILRNSPQLSKNLAWLAYWSARITRFTIRHTDDTFMNFKNVLMTSLKAGLRNNILDGDESQIADKIFNNLHV